MGEKITGLCPDISACEIGEMIGVPPETIEKILPCLQERQTVLAELPKLLVGYHPELDFMLARYEITGNCASVTFRQEFSHVNTKAGQGLPLEERYIDCTRQIYIYAGQASESIYGLIALLGMRGCIPGTSIKQHFNELKAIENPYTQGSVLLDSSRIPLIGIVLGEPPSDEFTRTLNAISQVNCVPISVIVDDSSDFDTIKNYSDFYRINLDHMRIERNNLEDGSVRFVFYEIPQELLVSDDVLLDRLFYDYVPTMLKARALVAERWRGSDNFPTGVRESVYLHTLRTRLLVVSMVVKIESLLRLYKLQSEVELYNPVALILMAQLHDVGEIFSPLADVPAASQHQPLLKRLARFLERDVVARLASANIIPREAVELYDAFEASETPDKWRIERCLCILADRLLGMRFFDENTLRLEPDALKREVGIRIRRNMNVITDLLGILKQLLCDYDINTKEFSRELLFELIEFISDMIPGGITEFKVLDDGTVSIEELGMVVGELEDYTGIDIA